MMKKFVGLLIAGCFLLMPLQAQKSSRSEPSASDQTVLVVLKERTLQIQHIKPGDKVEILNILGVRLIEKKADSASMDIQLDLPQGYYLVKVGSTVRKISLK
jgi:hypothetical protein